MTNHLPQHHNPLGEELVAQRLITRDQLRIALHEQSRSTAGTLLGNVLVRLGFVEDTALATLLAARSGLDDATPPQPIPTQDNLAALFPADMLRRCRVLPLAYDQQTLTLAMADPYDIVALDEVRRCLPPSVIITPQVMAEAQILAALQKREQQGSATSTLDLLLRELEQGDHITLSSSPIVRLIDTLIAEAVRQQASDIHFEPEEHFIRLRYRLDGVLHEVRALHRERWPEMCHRIKIMAGMNIAETRSAQDGRFTVQVDGTAIDCRVAVMPVVHGENIVIRLLDHRQATRALDALGYTDLGQAQIDHMLERPEGMVLVTGPTGSGKTTTLYAMLNRISDVSLNVMTLEEPVEYRFPMIRQTAVQDRHGFGFADGVRGVLRQDPDIILIGEVRDHDTAQMALRAAMTGHKVLTTLHCNEAAGAVTRLIDLNLTPGMLTGNIAGVIAQRLVRRLCPHCAVTRQATPREDALLRRAAEQQDRARAKIFSDHQAPLMGMMPFSSPLKVKEAAGCPACRMTGYRGRLVVAEIARFTPALDPLILDPAPRTPLIAALRREGFVSMAEDALGKVAAGLTSFDEIKRAVPYWDAQDDPAYDQGGV